MPRCIVIGLQKNTMVQKKNKAIFRLPTEVEWEKLSNLSTEQNFVLFKNTTNEEKCRYANIKLKNHKFDSFDDLSFEGTFLLTEVNSGKPNKIGLFNIIGNAAEITQEGVIKGGSWDNFIEECNIDKTQNYQLPDPRVGFRVVKEIIH